MPNKALTITKLDAARRQLNTAIKLWFTDGDAISIHTLSYAAYEIIHVISKPERNSRPLLWDTHVVKDEHRKEFNISARKHANFFKHADREPYQDAAIDFKPELSEGFILYSIIGIECLKLPANDEELAFSIWHRMHKPTLSTEESRVEFSKLVSIETLTELKLLSKKEFFYVFLDGRKRMLSQG